MPSGLSLSDVHIEYLGSDGRSEIFPGRIFGCTLYSLSDESLNKWFDQILVERLSTGRACAKFDISEV